MTVVVCDDDPTGAQSVAGVPALFAWTPEALRDAAPAGVVHLMTNARALDPSEARAITADAARTALAALDDVQMVLRGDSTLRGHVLEEYEGLQDAGAAGPSALLLLVPALPHAGRTTRDGVHRLDDVPLHETEYATDGGFAYTDSRLLAWAQERSGGRFQATDGLEVTARATGSALRALSAAGRPAVCVPDVADDADLAAVRDGLAEARAAGADVVIRAGPAFAALLGGRPASRLEPLPEAPDGVAVVCGSYIPTTTRQLAALTGARPDTLIEADLDALRGDDPTAEVRRLTAAAAARRVAVVATPRTRVPLRLDEGARVSRALAAVAARLPHSALITKGGITAHEVLHALAGAGAGAATVVGPVAHGVARWSAGGRDVLVVPGNVGADDLLVRLVDGMDAPC